MSASEEMYWIKATRLPIPYRNRHLHRPDIKIVSTDDMRKSLTKLKKDFKHRMGRKEPPADRAGVDAAGETSSSPALLMRPGSCVTARGHDEGGSRISGAVSQAHSRDPSHHLEPVSADEGHRDDSQVDVGEKEASQKHSHSDDVETAAGDGPLQEAKPVSSPLSVTPIVPKQEPDSVWTLSPQLLCLTIPRQRGHICRS